MPGFLVILLLLAASLWSGDVYAFTVAQNKFLADEDSLNLFCLRSSYPKAFVVRQNRSGNYDLVFPDGAIVPYASVRPSLAQPYALEPQRPDTPAGYAPGRARPYELFTALYGANPRQVSQKLTTLPLLGKRLTLSRNAAAALERAKGELLALPPHFRPWLTPEGGFHWRKIAGENNLSAHSYGIALDLAAKKAPYWRWAKIMPHPLQRDYPTEIVDIMERQGFIWGGKWHEYDLMHYEYRPEIICKARLKKALGQ